MDRPYDRNRPMVRTRRDGTEYRVPIRLWLEECGMNERQLLPNKIGTSIRRDTVELMRRARLDPYATPLRTIP
jgi:hypothetical protein